ncbi:MAG: TIGR04190 family B12-binding domain/radical SAM domain protein [Desulfuromonas sp.]|nr:MAG: TIGR04190 family B12-binding domain/radical SAM domain protein [Desulfuromonas sp.]
MSRIDLVLLHPPSVYDFRRKSILYGPVSDLIPSSPVFEMYPLGFLTITSYLEARGLKVRVINLALRMMNDPGFDVPAFLARQRPRAFGIDLHWLPHAHGSLAIAALAKAAHPEIPVIFGGYSASYFHEELIGYPQVDFVLRGDGVEAPLYDLMRHLDEPVQLRRVANLTWKDQGEIRVNPLSCVPENYDYVDIDPVRMMRMVLRHRDLQSVLPFNGWWKNPITAVFTVKGCKHQCQTCGGSGTAGECTVSRRRPAYRSPRNLVKNIVDISRISRGPIFLVGDLLQPGVDAANETLDLLAAQRLRNELVFEFFGMPPHDFLQRIDRSVRNWSLELSPESHDEAIRRRQDHTVFYKNVEMEETITRALELRCHRIDIFFMIGLAGQSVCSVDDSISYCEELFSRFDRRLSCFISPMGPFLDPGSRVFEDPAASGYRLFARTLEEHRQRLLRPSWRQILNYETDCMTRDDLVEATYAAAGRLNELKLRYGRIGRRRARAVGEHIARARELEGRLISMQGGQLDALTSSLLQGEINRFSVSTVCDKRELFWRRHLLNFRWGGILRELLKESFKPYRGRHREPDRLAGAVRSESDCSVQE